MLPTLPLAAKIVICILMLVFVFMSFPASGLTIRLYFDDFEGSQVIMYYTTDENPDILPEQILTATFDTETRIAVIKLSPELADHIVQIRLDFPEMEQVFSIKNVSVSSAGVIKHNYSPCDFFSTTNIVYQNDIPQINLLERKQIAYVKTNESDPYILFTNELVNDMLRYRSSFRLTRLSICILVVLGYAISRIGLFNIRQ